MQTSLIILTNIYIHSYVTVIICNDFVEYFLNQYTILLTLRHWGIEARIVLMLTRASLRLSCRTAAHGARVIKQNRRGSFRSVDMAGLAV